MFKCEHELTLKYMEVQMQNTQNKPDFTQIIKNNPSGYILRKNLTKQTGGLLHGRTMANLDSLGEGIPGKISIGRKIAYSVESVVEYLQSKVTVSHGVSSSHCNQQLMESKGL